MAGVYTPAVGFIGSESFTYTTSDGATTSNSATVVVTVDPAFVNTPPTAVADDYTVLVDSVNNTLAVRVNDSDVDMGQSLSIVSVGTPDQGGSVSHDGDVITYSPAAGYLGVETFSYVINDGFDDSAAGTVTLMVNAQPPGDLSQLGWSLHYVDSEELVGEDGGAVNGFDGDPQTIWHTQWQGGQPVPPHEVQIDLGAVYDLSGFRYLPRPLGQGEENGRIADYAFYVSTDGINWGAAVASGVFANDGSEKSVPFSNIIGRYVRLEALTEVNGGAFTSMAELNLISGSTVQSPVVTPGSGTYPGFANIEMVTATAGASIFYTLDASDPTSFSTPYTGPFILISNTVVKAVAVKQGFANSDTTTVTIDLKIMPAGFNGYFSFDEVSNNGYYDQGGGETATCTTCPTTVSGLVGNAQLFDGSSTEVRLDANYGWNSSTDFTVEFWMQADSCVMQEAVVGRRDAVSPLEWWLGCENGNAALYLIDDTGAGNVAGLHGSSSIADSEWHHVAAVYDTVYNEVRLYVDGQLEAVASTSYVGNFEAVGADLAIGWLDDTIGPVKHFSGLIDEVALHDRVLPDQVIRKHYEDGDQGLRRGLWGCESAVNIMPLGDSNTNAASGRKSYRPDLDGVMANAGYDFDFVGSRSDSTGTHDGDHEGWSGYTPADIAISLDGWLLQNPPDVVLLHIGTNGLASDIVANVAGVEDILNIIDDDDPDATVVLGRIINRSTHHQLTSDFNAAIDALAQTRIANGDKIIIVDHEPALVYPDDLVDDLHANPVGYEKMANVWQQGLNQFMPSCVGTTPIITTQAELTGISGNQYNYMVEASGYPAVDFSLTTAPSGMIIHPHTGKIAWTPSVTGSFDVTIDVTNAFGTVIQDFTIVVN